MFSRPSGNVAGNLGDEDGFPHILPASNDGEVRWMYSTRERLV
jgi:hypothetical protein